MLNSPFGIQISDPVMYSHRNTQMCIHTCRHIYTHTPLAQSIYFVVVNYFQMERTSSPWSNWLQSCCPGKVPASIFFLHTLQWLHAVSSLMVNLLEAELRTYVSPIQNLPRSRVSTHGTILALRNNSEYNFTLGGLQQARSKENLFCFPDREEQKTATYTHAYIHRTQKSRDYLLAF